jgi:predicted nucleic acid-binding protein
MKGIADTGFIVAFVNRADQFHEWAIAVARTVSEPLLTCEAVLSEAAFQVGSTDRVLALVQDGLLKIAFDLRKNLIEVQELAYRYRNRTPDLADLCLIRMSELDLTLPVLTVDEGDFRVYRRNKREVIPIVCPPRNDARRS